MNTQHDIQQEHVVELIAAYRRLGHLKASIDPLNLYPGVPNQKLDIAYYGFTNQDLKRNLMLNFLQRLMHKVQL